MKKLFQAFVFFMLAFTSAGFAQTGYLSEAYHFITLACSSGTANRSGVAYNPQKKLYYSVNAGSSSYPIETYNESGTKVNFEQSGFDYRGLWWNPNNNSLEGNGLGTSGIHRHNLNPTTGYAENGGTVFLAGTTTVNQWCGDYNYINNEIVYHNNGNIVRYSGTNNSQLATIAITGLPVATSNLNSNSIIYTGKTNYEYGVYDFTNRKLYLINLAGEFKGEIPLPNTAPQNSNFRMSFANNILFLYNSTSLSWMGYSLICQPTSSNHTISSCGPYTFNNQTYTESGVYTLTTTNSRGCDSIITLNLTVNPIPVVVANASANNVCPGSNVTLTGSGANTYVWDNDVENGISFTITSTQTYNVTGTDANNCSNSDEITITVTTDSEKPQITNVPSDIIINASTGSCSAVVSWTDPLASDNCTVTSFTSNHSSGSTFPIGTTIVTYTASDFSGNSSTASFTVQVKDNQNPVIEGLPSDITISAASGACNAVATWVTPTASDNCGDAGLSSTHMSGDIFAVGTTKVTYTATDNYGNNTTASFNIIVEDTQAPEFVNCPAKQTVCEGVYTFDTPAAVDNCSVAVLQTSGPLSGDYLTAGTYSITFEATDGSGNKVGCT
ncbi:MAG: HYR domain-containing protein [Cytophagaceae bacterium]